jgi:hypothetical protein
MPTRADIVSEARSWLNTPFGHGQAVKGRMVDCAHYIEAVNINAGVTAEPQITEPYRRREDGTVMLRLLKEHLELITIEEAEPGDVIALIDSRLTSPDIPRHLAFMTERRSDGVIRIIHASEHGVREHRMDGHWLRRIHSVWKVKGVE